MAKIETSIVAVPRSNTAGSMDSFFAKPEGRGPFPGMVVIHEIFGLNDNIRQISREFAGQGYAALAVDLFSNRNRAICMMQIFHGIMFRPLNNSMLADLNTAFDFLKQVQGVDAERIGAVGFCMGGSYALQMAITAKGMKAPIPSLSIRLRKPAQLWEVTLTRILQPVLRMNLKPVW
jgi:carboxymethylenebutenolidase